MTSARAAQRLCHIQAHINAAVSRGYPERAITNLLDGSGSAVGSLRSLESHARASAMYAWFKDGDLVACKSWFWSAALLQLKRTALVPREKWHGEYSMFNVLAPVCADDPRVWIAMGEVLVNLFHGQDRAMELKFISTQIGLIFRVIVAQRERPQKRQRET